ncbi:MAG: hypothetical protein GY953_53365, partial [bacterium]|nr:hypothetical protein [bacterium]
MKHQTQDPRAISEIRSGVPDELAAVCLKMMAKKPEDRFQNAAEVSQALDRWVGVAAAPVASINEPDNSNGPAAVELFGDDDAPEDRDNDEVKIAVADTGSFSVRTDSSRGRRPPAIKKPAQVAAALLEPVGFFADPRKKWATIVVAGLLLLGGTGGGLAWMLSGGDEAPSSAAEDSVASAQPAPSATAPHPAPEGGLDLDSDLDGLEAAFGGAEDDASDEKPVEAMQEPAPASNQSERTPGADQAEAAAKPQDPSVESNMEGSADKDGGKAP